MIQPCECSQWYPISVCSACCVKGNCIFKIVTVHPGNCISPKYVSSRMIIITLNCIIERRIFRLHSLQIVHHNLTPSTEGPLDGGEHVCSLPWRMISSYLSIGGLLPLCSRDWWISTSPMVCCDASWIDGTLFWCVMLRGISNDADCVKVRAVVQ